MNASTILKDAEHLFELFIQCWKNLERSFCPSGDQ